MYAARLVVEEGSLYLKLLDLMSQIVHAVVAMAHDKDMRDDLHD